MNKELFVQTMEFWFQVLTLSAVLILIWHIFAFIRNNPKKFGLSMQKYAIEKNAKRRRALWRLLIGLLISTFSFNFASGFLSVSTVIPQGSVALETAEMISASFFFASGFLIMLSSLWKLLRYLGELLFAIGFIYILIQMIDSVVSFGGNIYRFFAEFAYFYLPLFGFLFIVFTLAFSVKGLLAFDERLEVKAKQFMQQIFQIGIALLLLVISGSIMGSIAFSLPAPETLQSFILDSGSAFFRYALIFYFFGAFIYLRQVFPYFRYFLTGLISLFLAYVIFDFLNLII